MSTTEKLIGLLKGLTGIGRKEEVPDGLEDHAGTTQDGSPGTSRIPRQFHFLWGLKDKNGEPPPAYRGYLERWREMHGDWHLAVHGQREIEGLAARYTDYPYASYMMDIQRCDVCRPMLMHRFGGVYSDMDVEPHGCLDHLFAQYARANVLLGVEVEISLREARSIGRQRAIRKGLPEIPRRIGNYFMASTPGHPFWIEVLELMKSRASLPVREPYDVLYTTGPDIITETLHRTEGRFPDVAVIPRKILDRFITHRCDGHWRGDFPQ